MQETSRNTVVDHLLHLITPLLLLILLLIGASRVIGEVFVPDMIEDWLSREGAALFNWWLFTTFAGVAAFPILYRLVPGLPSRGYALARTAGIMLTGFIFWFLASLGFLTNDPGSIVLAWLLVIVIAWLLWTRRSDPEGLSLNAWFSENWTMVLVVEILFVAMFVFWGTYRAHEPEIWSTEKPMEIMFVNAIRQSETFPPNDGWLAGYSISYYYFGYVIIAGLADLSGLNTGIAFGMTGPLLFALSGIGALGVVYDLVRARDRLGRWMRGNRHAAIWAGLLAAVFLVVMGNLGTTLVELPWQGHMPNRDQDNSPFRWWGGSIKYFDFWSLPERGPLARNIAPQGQPEQWYLYQEDLTLPSGQSRPSGYEPIHDNNRNNIPDWEERAPANADEIEKQQFEIPWTRWPGWWWFRYSRVVSDRHLTGRDIGVQPITEFPHFSFILGDIHPHVFALPFAVLAIGLAAGLVLSGERMEWWGMVLLAIWVGGMIFMNSWDAVYIPFLIGAEALRRLIRNGTGRLYGRDWWEIFVFGVIILVLTIIFYLPWIVSFASQAEGIYFNIIWPTRPQQLFIAFGGFFLLVLPFLLADVIRHRKSINWSAAGLTFALSFVLIVVLLPFAAAAGYDLGCGEGSLTAHYDERAGRFMEPAASCRAMSVLFGENPDQSKINPGDDPKPGQPDFWKHVSDRVFKGADADPSHQFWADLLVRRLPSYPSHGLILLAIILIIFRLFPKDRNTAQIITYHPATGIALLALGAGLTLILLPDFVYLVDNFGVRINTVFKLYYQGWVFLSIASAYGVFYILNGGRRTPLEAEITLETTQAEILSDGEVLIRQKPKTPFDASFTIEGLIGRSVYAACAIIVILAGVTYPYYAFRSRGIVDNSRLSARQEYERCVEEAIAAGIAQSEEEATGCRNSERYLTLDGRPSAIAEHEWQIVQCLIDLEPEPGSVVAEAPFGGGYWVSGKYSRISTLTGVPTLLGWMGHERQWRGDTYDDVTETVLNEAGGVVSNREMKVDELYQTTDIERAQAVVDLYGIDYVMVGDTERARYGAEYEDGLEKFQWWLTPVCVTSGATLYQTR